MDKPARSTAGAASRVGLIALVLAIGLAERGPAAASPGEAFEPQDQLSELSQGKKAAQLSTNETPIQAAKSSAEVAHAEAKSARTAKPGLAKSAKAKPGQAKRTPPTSRRTASEELNKPVEFICAGNMPIWMVEGNRPRRINIPSGETYIFRSDVVSHLLLGANSDQPLALVYPFPTVASINGPGAKASAEHFKVELREGKWLVAKWKKGSAEQTLSCELQIELL
jgi:hypothetical protein